MSSLRILILEDSEFMVKIMRAILNSFNVFKIRHISALEDLYPTLDYEGIDLVLTDWELGTFRGSDVMKEIRLGLDCPNRFVPVIAISAYTDMRRINEMRSCGVDDVIVKPLSAELLYTRIARLIEEKPDYVRTDTYLGPRRNIEDPAAFGAHG